MNKGKFRVAHITSGEEMSSVWHEAGQIPPGPGAWQESIDDRVHEGFAVYVKGRALGSMLLRVAGVNPEHEPDVYKMIHNRFPGAAQPGVLQWLWVHPDHRRRGAAAALMGAGEDRIVDLAAEPTSKTAPAAALTGRLHQAGLRRMYISRQYEPITGDLWESSVMQNAPVWDKRLGRWVGRQVRLMVLVKNLSGS